jgi:flagellar hook-associated protein 1 FlgK
VEQLAAAPQDGLGQREVVRAGADAASLLRRYSNGIQDLRAEADQRIGKAIEEINGLLTKVADLNEKIVRNQATGQSVADLQDSRDQAVDRLSQLVDIRAVGRSNGAIVVFTAGGRTLVDGTATTLSHIAATGADASVAYAKGDFDGIYLGDRTAGNDITGDIRDGELSGRTEMRDKVLPDLQSSLDALATALRDTVNAVHNRGTGFPGLVAMAGSRVFTDPASQTITFGGASDTALIVFDADGAEVRHTTIRELFGGSTGPFKIQGDAGTPAIDNIDEAINTWLGADGTAEVADGRLMVTVKSAGLTLAFRDQVTGAAGSPRQDADIHFDADGDGNADQTAAGFSSFFGLNDFFVDQASPDETGRLVVGAASSIKVRADIVADPSLVSRGAVQWDAGRVPSGGYAVSAGDDSVVQHMATALAASAEFAAAGRLPAMNTGLADYAASLISDASALASETDGTSEFQQNLVDTLRQKSDSVRGVNLDEELSDLMLYEQSYSAAARVVSAIKDMFDVLDRAVG